MSLYFRLMKLQFNQRFGFSVIKAGLREDPKKMIGKIAIFLTAVVGILSIVGMYAWLLYTIIPGFQQAGLESLVLGIVLMFSMVFVFFMGFIYLIGILFFAKDTEFLFSLPIPQRTIFASKFSQVLLGEIGTSALILLPAFIIFGIVTKVEIMFWVRMLPVIILAPCIPLGLSGILALLLMRFNALWRRRDLMTIIGSVVMVVALMAGQMYLQSFMQRDMTTEAITSMLLSQSQLLSNIVAAFPPSGWAAEGLLHGGGQFLLFYIASIAVFIAVLLLSNILYKRGAMAQTEALRKGRKVRMTGGAMRQKGVFHALVLREWRLIIRTPVYALNGLIMIIIGPLMTALLLLTQNISKGDLDPIFDLLQNAVDVRLTMLCITALFMVFASINTAISTSMSREGKLFYLLRVFPVSAHKQIFAKFTFGYLICAAAIAMMALMVFLLLPVSGMVLLSAIALGLLACVAPTALSMVMDVIKPKLNWNSETEAIKQNFNAMTAMVLEWLYLAAVGFGTYLLIDAGLDLSVVIGIDVAFCTLAAGVSLFLLGAMAKRSLIKIEG